MPTHKQTNTKKEKKRKKRYRRHTTSNSFCLFIPKYLSDYS